MFKRDFAKPTLEDHFDKTVLPKVMQVCMYMCSVVVQCVCTLCSKHLRSSLHILMLLM